MVAAVALTVTPETVIPEVDNKTEGAALSIAVKSTVAEAVTVPTETLL